MTFPLTRSWRTPGRMWLAALPLALLAACGGGDDPVAVPGGPPPGNPGNPADPGDPPAPPAFALAALEPADGSTQASTTTTLAVRYNRALDFTDVAAASLSLTDITRSGTVALRNFTRDGTAGFSITPSNELSLATRYRIDFRPMRSADGQTLPATSTTFATRDGAWEPPVTASVREDGLAELPVFAASRPGSGIVLYQRRSNGGFSSLLANRLDGVSRQWSPTEAILFDGPSQLVQHALAVSATGFAVAIWVRDVPGQDSHLFASTLDLRAGNSTWTAPVRVDTAVAAVRTPATVAIDDQGNVLAAWVQEDPGELPTLHTRYYQRETDSWEPVTRQPSTTGAHGAPTRIAFDNAGKAYLLWVESNTVHWARRQASGDWDAAAPALEIAGCAMRSPGIALNPQGSGVLYAECSSGQTLPQVWVRDVVAGATVGAPISLDGPNGQVHGVTAAVNAGGQAVMAWHRSGPNGVDVVQSVLRAGLTGTWSLPLVLLPDNPQADEPVDAPSAVIDEHGNAMVAWSQRVGDGIAFRVRYNALTGAWSTADRFPGIAFYPVLSVDQRGRIIALWEDVFPTGIVVRSAEFK